MPTRNTIYFHKFRIRVHPDEHIAFLKHCPFKEFALKVRIGVIC